MAVQSPRGRTGIAGGLALNSAALVLRMELRPRKRAARHQRTLRSSPVKLVCHPRLADAAGPSSAAVLVRDHPYSAWTKTRVLRQTHPLYSIFQCDIIQVRTVSFVARNTLL